MATKANFFDPENKYKELDLIDENVRYKTKTKISPFDYVNSISTTNQDIMIDRDAEEAYEPYMINRAFSYYPDTVMYANEMNRFALIDHRLQYDFLINSIRTRKRPRTKWAKKIVDDDLKAVMEYYGYNMKRAEEALSILSPDQINIIKKRIDKGGTK